MTLLDSATAAEWLCPALFYQREGAREPLPRDAPGLAAMLCCPLVSPSKELPVVREEEQWQGGNKAIGATIGVPVPLLPGAGPSLLHPRVSEMWHALRLMAKREVCFRHN